ncbi:MAG: hypothetical protein Kow0077_24270 [Anaerolineae bacterium]
MRMHSGFRLFTLLMAALALLLAALPALPIAAQAGDGQPLPPPHLGYGIHLGPHLPAPPDLIRRLGMDWVKVYEAGQVADYPMFRTLYRMDLDWPNDWNYFRSEVARRTRELVANGVDAIEIHNEPNLSLEWPRGPNAWEYTQMLRVAYGIIKEIAPDVIVVSGGLAPTITTPDRAAINDLDFAREMLENGAADYFDAFGYHPYGFNQPPETDPATTELTFRRAERIHELLVAYGAGDKPIWLTEFGWLRDPAESGRDCSTSPAMAGFDWMRLPERVVADYTVRAFRYADEHWPWAGPMFLWNLNWQQYEHSYEDPCSHLRWYGILEPDGSPTATFNAVAAMPRRYSAYLPRVEARPLPPEGYDTPQLNRDGQWTYALAAFCPRTVAVGEFEVINTGWPAAVNFTVEPQNAPVPGMPQVFVSTDQARFGDRVTIYADASETAPGEYLLVVNLRGQYGTRPISGHVMLLLQVDNSPINCQ